MDAVTRVDPPYRGDELSTLLGFLDYQRATLARKCEGLSPDQLRLRADPPSNLSLLGLLRHLAEVERGWFRSGIAGEDIGDIWCSDQSRDADLDDVDTAEASEAFQAWQAEIDAAQVIARTTPLDATMVHRSGDTISLRWVLVHMIEEYARHNGHADLLREHIDGSKGE
jgi:uncharacterized damage-inducible protein DinB